MSCEIEITRPFERCIRDLKKKYPHVKDDLKKGFPNLRESPDRRQYPRFRGSGLEAQGGEQRYQERQERGL